MTAMWAQWGACLLLSVALSACTAPQTQQWSKNTPISQAVQQLTVPFFAQEDHQCGPAALASMLQFSGVAMTPERLVGEVYIPDRQGSYATELIAATRRHQRIPYLLAPKLSAIFTALEHGQPVLVLQNNGLSLYPVWHFAVVVGVDYAHQELILHSGRTAELRIDFSTFERTWARSEYWAMLVLSTDAIASWLEPEPLLQQLANLEKYGELTTAKQGYEQALKLWPNEIYIWFGLANTAVRLKQWSLAEQSFLHLIEHFPNFAPALNNYADFLLRQGQAQKALGYAKRAVELQADVITQQTLAEIEQALAH